MTEYINEAALNENIPRDLLTAYEKSRAYDSSEHPATDHTIINSRNRRTARYRYGNATYRVLSVEEALRLIAENPHNVEYIRGIKDGELVEYEYQSGSNKYYALYGNPDRPVSYTKPNGEEVTKRNIRYITNPKIWLPLLDKIYWTDEYQYPISDEEQEERQNRLRTVGVATFNPVADDSYNQFRPAAHMQKNVKVLRPTTPDTGYHRSEPSYNKYFRDAQGSLTGDTADTTSLHLDEPTRQAFDNYTMSLDLRAQSIKKYTQYRKALKKLERDRDDYDEEEYQELYAKWTAAEKSALQTHQNIALQCSRAESILKKYYNSTQEECAQKFAKVVAELEKALKNCERLKTRIDDLKAKAVNALQLSDLELNYNAPERAILNSIKDMQSQITRLINDLQNLETRAKELDHEEDSVATEITGKIAEIQEHQRSVDALKRALFATYSAKYKDLHQQMLDIEVAVNKLKPTRAAKKAAKAAAAGKAVLDPEIAGIIRFEDEPAATTEPESEENA